ncbi:MAG: HAMP domain-containing protein, partial [Thiothrix sp.]
MATTVSLRNRLWRWLPLVVAGILLLASLALLNMITLSPVNAQRYQYPHLVVSLALLLILGVALLYHLLKLYRQWRTHQAGSRFTLRLMSGFLILILLPMSFIALFAVNLLGTRIDRWLAVNEVRQGLEDAVQLSSLSLAVRQQQHLGVLRALADNLLTVERAHYSALLEKLLANGASEVLLLDASLQLTAQAMQRIDTLLPRLPDAEMFRVLQYRPYYYALDQQGGDRLVYRAAIKVRYGKQREQMGILTALFPVPEEENSLTQSLQAARQEFVNLAFQRDVIKQAFGLSIVVLTVLTTLFSLWAAFVFSRRLTRPVRTLVEGTLAVAAGDLDKKLPVSERDDFSTLAMSFNTMTKRLADARAEREQARRQLQQQHDYLNAVLEHLTSGVITLDAQGVIRRCNSAASHILQQPLQPYVGQTLSAVAEALPMLQSFFQMAAQRWQESRAQAAVRDWQTELTLNTERGHVIVVCRGASLPANPPESGGAVLVFDDITDLIQAEHDAAWGEVARRLAHEIKNPLTPIQLSAERLTRKLSAELSDSSADFLKRMTTTSIQQVDNLKAMVNAFGEYARAPSLHLQPTDLNALVQDVVELYRHNEAHATLHLQLASDLPV